jgi:hypothetical protein
MENKKTLLTRTFPDSNLVLTLVEYTGEMKDGGSRFWIRTNKGGCLSTCQRRSDIMRAWERVTARWDRIEKSFGN